METFRLEVGLAHNVKPGNIVGAIANEAGIEGRHIGRIRLYDEYSTVDLPEGMPADIFNGLKKTRVAGRPLNISRMNEPKKRGDSVTSPASHPASPAGQPVPSVHGRPRHAADPAAAESHRAHKPAHPHKPAHHSKPGPKDKKKKRKD